MQLCVAVFVQHKCFQLCNSYELTLIRILVSQSLCFKCKLELLLFSFVYQYSNTAWLALSTVAAQMRMSFFLLFRHCKITLTPEMFASPTCGCVFSDSGQSNHGTSAKGERLSVKLKTLPGSNEPYEASTQQEIGEKQHWLLFLRSFLSLWLQYTIK